MANLSVEKLATVIGSAPELLLSQMQEAGLTHTNLSDEVTDSDKKTLWGVKNSISHIYFFFNSRLFIWRKNYKIFWSFFCKVTILWKTN